MKRILILLTIGLMAFGLSACETMKGFGKDVESGGEWVQEKAS